MSALHLLPALLDELEAIFDEIAQISHGLMLSNVFMNRQIQQLTPAEVQFLELNFRHSQNANQFAWEHRAKTRELTTHLVSLEAALAVRVALADRSPAARRQLSYWVLSLPE